MPPPPPPPPPGPPPAPQELLTTQNTDSTLNSQQSLSNGQTQEVPNSSNPSNSSSNLKPWEKALTVEEIRKSSTNWSLSSDSGMLLYLQEFSQKVISRTHEIEKEVDKLVNDTKSMDSSLHNVFNNFLMMSNTQFVENRVYDDSPEEQENKDGGNKKDKKEEKEKTREERETDLIPKITEALGYGLGVLENQFDKLDIKAGNSDSEDEEASTRIEPLLEPKDIYAHRPLPFIIGSQQFMVNDDIGLANIPSDEEEVEFDHGSLSESEEEKRSTESSSEESDSESASNSEESEGNDIHDKTTKVESNDERGIFTGSSDNANEISSEEDEKSEKPAVNDFSSELSSKLGISVSQRERSESKTSHKSYSSQGSDVSGQKKKRKKKKSHQQKQEQEDHHDDLFGTNEEEDDSLFAKKDGLFSGGKGLFDDDGGGKGLFDDDDKDENKDIKNIEENVKDEDDHGKPEEIISKKESKHTYLKSGKKLPAGAVSVFGSGSDNLFSPTKAEEKDLPTNPLQTSEELFGDNNEDDLFSSSSKPQKTKANEEKKGSILFEDEEEEEEEDDLFDHHKKKPNQPNSEKKKLPVGAVSIFGNSEISPSDVTKSAVTSKTKNDPVLSNTQSEKSSKKSAIGATLFNEEEEDDLFTDTKRSKQNQKPLQKQSVEPKPKDKSSGLFFDDDEDDLFSSTAKPSSKSVKNVLPSDELFSKSADESLLSDKKDNEKTQKKVKSEKIKVSLFDNDEGEDSENDENGGGLFSTRPPPLSVEKATKPRSKSKSLFEDEDVLFGKSQDSPDVDLFGPSSPIKPTSPTVTKNPPTVASSTKKASSGLFSEAEDDLFTSPEKKTSTNLSTNERKEKNTRPAAASADLFDSGSNSSTSLSTKERKEKNAKPTAASADLFGGGSDGEELFGEEEPRGPKTVAADNTILSDGREVDAHKINTSSSVQENVAKTKKPVGGVSMFGGLDPHLLKTSKQKAEIEIPPEKTGEIDIESNNDDGDSLFSKQPPPFPQETKLRSSSGNSLDGPSPFSRTANLPTLKSVSPPKAKTVFQGSEKTKTSHPVVLAPSDTPFEKKKEEQSVGFDHPVKTETLHSLQKDRVKVQRKRRPPSRKGTTSTPVLKSDDNQAVSDKLVSTPKTKEASSEPVFKAQPHSFDEDEDLFLDSKKQRRDLKSSLEFDTKKQKDLEDDELFGSADVKSKQDKKLAQTNIFEDEKDLFSGTAVGAAAAASAAAATSTTPPPITTTKNQESKEIDNLFSDTTDIFSNLPANKPKESKKKKKKEQSLFNDIEGDDIFASTNKVTKKSKKKAEKKQPSSGASIFDTDAPSIFDDPLNATKQ